MFKWIFLVPIELMHNPKHVHIVGPETEEMCQFLGPETDIMGERYFMVCKQVSASKQIKSCVFRLGKKKYILVNIF